MAAGKEMTDENTNQADGGTDENPLELVARVEEIVSEISGKPLPEKNIELTALGIDSMAKLDILASLEEHFDVILNESMVEEFHTVAHIAKIVGEAMRTTPSR